jgi:hypothetical protein
MIISYALVAALNKPESYVAGADQPERNKGLAEGGRTELASS